jgi:DNA polymerase I-like protein with 3'-5' exonuclease and polymerase domains
MVQESAIDEFCAIVKDTMEHPAGVRDILGQDIPVPLEVDFKIGETWAG